MASLRTYLTLYLAVAIPFWVLDAVWLGAVARRFYAAALGPLMARRVKIIPALVFYLTYPVGLALFALYPATIFSIWWHPLVLGGLFGAFCYGTYDLVNHATLEGWPLRLTLVDLAWGTCASAVATTIAAHLLAAYQLAD